ncbi:MAG: N-acetylmuramoyl-L-alanine amidase family protein [Anaerolineae bacterium]
MRGVFLRRARRAGLAMALELALFAIAVTGCTLTDSESVVTVSPEPLLTLSPTQPPVTLTPGATATLATPTASPSPTPSMTPLPTPRAFAVALDPGHGGIDLGARRFDDDGHMVYHESTVNLELGLLVRDELLARGFLVVMTRDTDSTVSEDGVDVGGDGEFEYTLDETQARVDLVNASGADLLLSLHHNAYAGAPGEDTSSVGGIQTYYCADRPFSDDNYRFAGLIHARLMEAIREYGYDIQDRGLLDDAVLVTPDSPGKHLIMLGPESERIVRPSQMPGALSEPLFITHTREGELARAPAFLATLAVAYADAIEAYVDGVQP